MLRENNYNSSETQLSEVIMRLRHHIQGSFQMVSMMAAFSPTSTTAKALLATCHTLKSRHDIT
jgi:hypothetical protein